MLIHYFVLSVRYLTKRWFHSLLNILGLGIGIASCILIFMYAKHETGFDNFYRDSDRIFRVTSRHVWASGEVGTSTLQPYQIAQGFKDDIPGVEFASGYRRTSVWIGYKEKKFREIVGFADADFFKIFQHTFLAGNEEVAIQEIPSVVLTRNVADKIFGDSISDYSQIVGQILQFPQRSPNLYEVTAIIENIPKNASLTFDVIIPYVNAQFYPRSNNAFGSNSVYLKLAENVEPDEIVKIANTLIDKYRGPLIQELIHFGSLMDSEDNFRFLLQPLKEVYLHSTDMSFGYERKGNIQNIYILSAIAFIVLIIACVNYVMLAIGQSMDRLKEMGIKKILGAHKKQIIQHFIIESLILVILAMVIGITIAKQLLPVFNTLSEKNLTFTFYSDPAGYLYLFVILFMIVLSTGGYISLFLFKHSNPLSILRNEIAIGKRYRFAGSFVVLQYFISVALLIITVTIVRQLDYMIHKPVGFDRENITVMSVDFPISRTLLLKQRLKDYPTIQSVTMSDRNFVRGRSSNAFKSKTGELIETRILRIDSDYLETYGIELVEGRNFAPNHQDDTVYSILVNETFQKAFELNDPVNQKMYLESEGLTIEIIGVVKDFHYDSMKDPVMPLIMHVAPRNSIWYVFVKIDPNNIYNALKDINSAWDDVVPEYQIDYIFLNESLKEQYGDQKRWSRIMTYSALIAIFLSCLGLIGLTGLLVSKRVKEIGIRKVNGASILDIIILINSKFQLWVFFAFVLACFPAFFAMRRWLQNFTYKLPLAWWVFVLAGLFVMVIGFITVTWVSWRFARKDPVTTIRYE